MGNSHGKKDKKYGAAAEAAPNSLKAAARNAGPIHEGAILGVSSISGVLIACSDDKQISHTPWFDASPPANPIYFKGHTKAINKVIISHAAAEDGRIKMWSISRDLSIRQWDLDERQSIQTIHDAHSLNISAIVESVDCSRIYTGSRDYCVKAWDVSTGKPLGEFSAPRNIVTALECDPRGAASHLLFQGSEDLCVRVWDVRTFSKQPAMHITGFVYFPLSMSIHPSGLYVATGCKGFESVGCDVKLWDVRNTAQPVQVLTGHTHDVTGCNFTSSGSRLLTCSKDGSLIAWDTTSGGVGSVEATAAATSEAPSSSSSSSSSSALSASNCAEVHDDRYFTCLTQYEQGSTVRVALGAFDGSILYYDLVKDAATSSSGDAGEKFVPVGSTTPFMTAERIFFSGLKN